MTPSAGISAGALPATVTHELHKEHKLSLVVNTRNFGCDVCKQYGEGSTTEHYRCEPCDFDAHAECAMAPATLKHVSYPGDMVLCSGSGDPQSRYCDLCGRQVLGYRYHNRDTDHRLHPCCAFLPKRVVQDGRAFDLGYHPSGKCGMCKSMSTASLSYCSTYDDGNELFLHVWCLVDTNNRLTGYPDWVASAPIRPGVMGSFTRRNRKEGGDLFKVAKVSFGVVRFVLHVATFDFGSAAGAVKDVVDVAKDVLN